jgi:hypothetical protein
VLEPLPEQHQLGSQARILGDPPASSGRCRSSPSGTDRAGAARVPGRRDCRPRDGSLPVWWVDTSTRMPAETVIMALPSQRAVASATSSHRSLAEPEPRQRQPRPRSSISDEPPDNQVQAACPHGRAASTITGANAEPFSPVPSSAGRRATARRPRVRAPRTAAAELTRAAEQPPMPSRRLRARIPHVSNPARFSAPIVMDHPLNA